MNAGMFCVQLSRASGVRPKNCGSIGVSIGPGQITLARMPSPAT